MDLQPPNSGLLNLVPRDYRKVGEKHKVTASGVDQNPVDPGTLGGTLLRGIRKCIIC